MIPEAAVEAAAKVLLGDELGREVEELEGELWSDDIEARKDLARKALEAAAPHMCEAARDEGYRGGLNEQFRNL